MAIETREERASLRPAHILDEPAQTPESGLIWDLRPKGPIGNLESEAGRQRARLLHLISVGAVVIGKVEGRFTRNRYTPGGTIREDVAACEPIPLIEMIPHSDIPLNGFVTPIWQVGKAEFLRTEEIPPERET